MKRTVVGISPASSPDTSHSMPCGTGYAPRMGGAPYRGGPGEASASGADETGLVADLIAQFADRLAFYRELVQNAIDAGSVSIGVRVVWDAGFAVVAVRDAGVGMSREVIEEQLLVLFRSGKEDRQDAIGKFGVGFVSVLAVDPEVVEVHSSTGDGEAHVLHLRRDQSWDLFEVDGATSAGTTVKLRVPMPVEAYGQFVADSRRALGRWCCHARVPIHFTASDAEGEPLAEDRIDRPLDLSDALVSVDASQGDFRIVAGVHRDGRSFAGFYNGGLMLYETADPLVGSLMFKVQAPHLEHTLSRDNVRRDAAYEKALREVRRVVQERLWPAVVDALVEAAEEDRRRYRALLDVLDPEMIEAQPGRWSFPVLAPIDGRRSVPAAERQGLYGRRRGPLIDALAARGVPVFDAEGLDEDELRSLSALVGRAGGSGRLIDAHALYTLLVPEAPAGYDEALLAGVGELLDRAARAPASIHFARVFGAGSRRCYLAGSKGPGDAGEDWLLDDAINADPLRLLLRPALVFDVAHPLVRAARGAMEVEPEVATAFLARAVLGGTGRLNDAVDDTLTEAALVDLLGLASLPGSIR